MQIDKVKLVCFSPTGTSKSVIQGISQGLEDQWPVELMDITRPKTRQTPLKTSQTDLLMVAVPVYMGRVPALLSGWFKALKADNTPAVAVVVYGNRAYENALLELTDILSACGCRPAAAAACIGEHSFSSPETPTAQGRPDPDDQDTITAFGRQLREKLLATPSPRDLPSLTIPGERPYGGVTELWSVDFIAVNDQCIQCSICAKVCPVDAVDPEDSSTIDTEKCITCCACIKNCPQEARAMKPGPVRDAAVRLNSLYSERKAPDFFLA